MLIPGFQLLIKPLKLPFLILSIPIFSLSNSISALGSGNVEGKAIVLAACDGYRGNIKFYLVTGVSLEAGDLWYSTIYVVRTLLFIATCSTLNFHLNPNKGQE